MRVKLDALDALDDTPQPDDPVEPSLRAVVSGDAQERQQLEQPERIVSPGPRRSYSRGSQDRPGSGGMRPWSSVGGGSHSNSGGDSRANAPRVSSRPGKSGGGVSEERALTAEVDGALTPVVRGIRPSSVETRVVPTEAAMPLLAAEWIGADTFKPVEQSPATSPVLSRRGGFTGPGSAGHLVATATSGGFGRNRGGSAWRTVEHGQTAAIFSATEPGADQMSRLSSSAENRRKEVLLDNIFDAQASPLPTSRRSHRLRMERETLRSAGARPASVHNGAGRAGGSARARLRTRPSAARDRSRSPAQGGEERASPLMDVSLLDAVRRSLRPGDVDSVGSAPRVKLEDFLPIGYGSTTAQGAARARVRNVEHIDRTALQHFRDEKEDALGRKMSALRVELEIEFSSSATRNARGAAGGLHGWGGPRSPDPVALATR